MTQIPRSKSAAHWLQVTRSHARTPFGKRANALTDGQDNNFEAALSNLAHSYLRDRAPQLLDYELGFQLIERSPDDNKAVGVFGFKVGPQLLYIPVFFLNGELKGHELLYLKDSDTFVPCKEKWLDYILSRKPSILGEEVTSNMSQLGVSKPDLNIFRDSPQKYASAYPHWLQPAMPGLMYAIGRVPSQEPQVPKLIKESSEAATALLQIVTTYPQTVKPIVAAYGSQIIADALQTAKTASCKSKNKAKKKSKKIQLKSVKTAKELANEKLHIWIYDSSNPKCASGLSEKRAQDLQRDGVIVSDERTDGEVSHAYKVQEPLSLQNPDTTGIYQVLCKPNDFVRCLYIHSPFGPRGNKPNAVLVNLENDGEKAWTETHSADIFVSDDWKDADCKTYRKWFDELPESTSCEVGSQYVIVAPNGQGTGVFEIKEKLPSVDDEKCYEVWWETRGCGRRPDHMPPVAERCFDRETDYGSPDTISIDRIKGSKFVVRRNCVYTPVDAKVVKIRGKRKDSDDYGMVCCDSYAHSDNSSPPALRPGNHIDLQMGIYKMSQEIRVFNNGYETIVNGMRMSPIRALVSLVRDYGLREKAAKDMLSQAQRSQGFKGRIKLAQPYDMSQLYGSMQPGPSAPGIPEPMMGADMYMGSQVPTQLSPDEQFLPVEDLQGETQRPSMAAPPEPMLANQIMQASQTGQKEILDTGILANLLKTTQNETLIDKYLANLMKGLDSLGRLLFNLYWHHDKFEDRYGADDLPELTDAMRNAFESLGDVTLELKKKTIEPYPGEGPDMPLSEGEL